MILLNEYILVKEIESRDEQLKSGLILPEQEQQEDQVAQGKVLQADDSTEVKKDDIILFHKMIPVDAQLKMENGDLERVWFIREQDIICVL